MFVVGYGRTAMNESPINRLTDGQRACLRLVLEHKQTKQIARELSIAPDTVKQRLGIAMRALGVETRVQAALLLRQHEEGMHARSVYPPQTVAEADPAPAGMGLTDEPPVESGSGVASTVTDVVDRRRPPSETAHGVDDMEAAHALTIGLLLSGFAARLGFGKPEPAGAGAGNRLAPVQRILLIVFVAIGSVLSITGLVSAVRELALLRR